MKSTTNNLSVFLNLIFSFYLPLPIDRIYKIKGRPPTLMGKMSFMFMEAEDTSPPKV